jgi:hypothetical protein
MYVKKRQNILHFGIEKVACMHHLSKPASQTKQANTREINTGENITRSAECIDTCGNHPFLIAIFILYFLNFLEPKQRRLLKGGSMIGPWARLTETTQ